VVLQRPGEAERQHASESAAGKHGSAGYPGDVGLDSFWSLLDYVACNRRSGDRDRDIAFVGEGRGAYKKVETLVYVGEGNGSFDPTADDQQGGQTSRSCTQCTSDAMCGVNRAECIVRFCVGVIVVLLVLGVACLAISIAGGDLLKEPAPVSGVVPQRAAQREPGSFVATRNYTAAAAPEVAKRPERRMAVRR